MKCGGKIIVCLAVSLAWTMACEAFNGDSSDGPYRAIVDRNIFDLKPIPPPTAPPDPALSTPPPNVTLIGLMMISGHPQAVISVQDPTPGRAATNYVLGEDQRQATIEVVRIDYAGKKATVEIGGDTAELKLQEFKGTASAGPGAGSLPGQRPIMPGGRRGMPGGFGGPGGAGFTPMGGNIPAAPSASYNPGVNPDAGAGGLPTRQVRTDASDDQLTAEQQTLLIEAQREKYLNEGNPIAQLLPPTALTQALQAQRDAANQPASDTPATPSPTPTGPYSPAWAKGRTTGNFALPPMPGQ